MPEEEKDKIRIRPLCLNIGGMIMLCGLVFLLKGLLADVSSNWFTIAMVVWMVLGMVDVRFISKSKRYIVK